MTIELTPLNVVLIILAVQWGDYLGRAAYRKLRARLEAADKP